MTQRSSLAPRCEAVELASVARVSIALSAVAIATVLATSPTIGFAAAVLVESITDVCPDSANPCVFSGDYTFENSTGLLDSDGRDIVFNRGTTLRVAGGALEIRGGSLLTPDGPLTIFRRRLRSGEADFDSDIALRGLPSSCTEVVERYCLTDADCCNGDSGCGSICINREINLDLAMRKPSGSAESRAETERNLFVDGGRIRIQGVINLDATAPQGTGGRLTISGNEIEVDASVSARGRGENGQGGEIEIDGLGDVDVRGDLDVGGNGGEVIIYADRLMFDGSAKANAYADTGSGGDILISGDDVYIGTRSGRTALTSKGNTHDRVGGDAGVVELEATRLEIDPSVDIRTQGGAGAHGGSLRVHADHLEFGGSYVSAFQGRNGEHGQFTLNAKTARFTETSSVIARGSHSRFGRVLTATVEDIELAGSIRTVSRHGGFDFPLLSIEASNRARITGKIRTFRHRPANHLAIDACSVEIGDGGSVVARGRAPQFEWTARRSFTVTENSHLRMRGDGTFNLLTLPDATLNLSGEVNPQPTIFDDRIVGADCAPR